MTEHPAPESGPALRLVDRAFDGPIDVVGDVHGEIDALEDLLRALGYSGPGEHPAGRRLVFIGDLCDRGPDSPRVIRRVRELVEAGTAQCLLGNHELNVLRRVRKDANGWFFADDHDRAGGVYGHSRPARDDDERQEILRFFATLPLALERDDLRLVHACWHEPSLAALRGPVADAGVLDLYRRYEQGVERRSRALGRDVAVRSELERFGTSLRDPGARVPMLAALAEDDLDYQMSNPLRVLTSGIELPAPAPYFLAGKWRMVERGEWWQDDTEERPVIFGHYWRWPSPDGAERLGPHALNPFPGRAAHHWLGRADRAFCNDYCVGARFVERLRRPHRSFWSRLGAVRWPERELVFDDGRRFALATAPRGDSTALRKRS